MIKDLTFSLEKETKGAYQYKETDEQGKTLASGYLIGTLYLRKDALGGQKPQSITVKVQF